MSTSIDIITIHNDEELVKFLLADEYEAYRKMYPNDDIGVVVEADRIAYSAQTDEWYSYSYFKSLHPVEFAEAVRRIQEYGEGKK